MALTDSLVSYWKLDEASGDRLDTHGGNDLVDHNGTGSGTGKVNTAADSNGTDEYLAAPDDASLDITGDVSISFWLNTSGNSWKSHFGKWDASGNQSYLLQIYTDDKVYWVFSGTGGNTLYRVTDSTVSRSGWHMLTATYVASSQTAKIYYDGGEVASTVVGTLPATLFSGNSPFSNRYLGGGEQYSQGLQDEVGLWSRALTADEVAALYNAGDGLSYDDFAGGGTEAASVSPAAVTLAVPAVTATYLVAAGPNSPGTGADDAGVGTVTWSNPGNVTASDDARATAVGANPVTSTSHYLKATDFGFSVPAGATISGIVVGVEKSKDSLAVADSRVRIVKGGAIGSTNKTGAAWTTTDTYDTYGSATDLWGETWGAPDVNAGDFGVALSVTLTGDGEELVPTARVDHVRVTVYYTPAYTASVSPAAVVLSAPAVTATYVQVRTASAPPVVVTLTVPGVTASYVQAETASAAPASVTLAVPAVAATYVQVETASVSPAGVTLTIPAVTVTYVYQATASVSPAGVALTAPAATASYAAVISASVSPVGITISVPEVTATHSGGATASVSPVEVTLTVPAVNASYSAVISASVSPAEVTIAVPEVEASAPAGRRRAGPGMDIPYRPRWLTSGDSLDTNSLSGRRPTSFGRIL